MGGFEKAAVEILYIKKSRREDTLDDELDSAEDV